MRLKIRTPQCEPLATGLLCNILVMCLSSNSEQPKDYTIFMILTSNTEATENKFQFLNFAYTVKEYQCHSNNPLQLLELKGKNSNKTIHVI